MSDIRPAAGSAIRRRDDRDRCVEALQMANARGPGNLDVPALRQLLDFPKPDFDIVIRRIFDAINAVVRGEQPGAPPRFVDCPKCGEPLEARAPEIQIDDLRQWQQMHAAYYHWSERELKLLTGYRHRRGLPFARKLGERSWVYSELGLRKWLARQRA